MCKRPIDTLFVFVCSSTFLRIRCSLRSSLSHKLHFAHSTRQQTNRPWSTILYSVCIVFALILQDSVPFIFFNSIICLCAAIGSCWGQLSISMSLNIVADICRLYIYSIYTCIDELCKYIYIYIHTRIYIHMYTYYISKCSQIVLRRSSIFVDTFAG